MTLAPGVAHSRTARPRRAARHSAQRECRRGGVAVPRVRRSAGDRPAGDPVRPAGAKVIVDGVGSRRRAADDHGSGAWRSPGRAAEPTARAPGTPSTCRPEGRRRWSCRWAPSRPAGPVSGWVAVKAPFTMEIREQGRLLGTTETDRIMMAAGRHELELRQRGARLSRRRRVVQVARARSLRITLDLPQGVVNLNAAPVGGSLDRRAARRRDADRQPGGRDRTARSRVQAPAARREASCDLGHARRAASASAST